MHIRRCMTARTPDDNSLAILVPLEDGAWTDTQLLPNLGRHGDLTLGGELRVGERHEKSYHGNEADLPPGWQLRSPRRSAVMENAPGYFRRPRLTCRTQPLGSRPVAIKLIPEVRTC